MQCQRIAAALSATLLIGAASAGVSYAQSQMPAAVTAAESELSGEVMVVNTETRLMTLRDADGEFHVLHVPPEITRLDKIKIGDKVTITEFSSALIALVPKKEAGQISSEMTTDIDRTPGKKPGGTVTKTLTLSGEIVGLNKADGQVTIKGPSSTQTFSVEDRSMLDGVKVGDGVVARFRNVVTGEVK
jgi:Cu/Ag efflux protein CusF